MKKCSECGSSLKEIDFIGTFFTPMFKGWFTRAFWPVPRLIFSLIGVVLINEFTPKEISIYLVVGYLAVVFILLSIRYKKHFDDIIYECEKCHKKYKGIKRESFNYGVIK
jgi:hypothetical protein